MVSIDNTRDTRRVFETQTI